MKALDLTLLEFIAITLLVWVSSSIDSIDPILKFVVAIAGIAWIIYRIVDNEKRGKPEKIEHTNKVKEHENRIKEHENRIKEHENRIKEHENRIKEHSNRMIIQDLEIKQRKLDYLKH